ncbi:cytochrome C [Rhodosalinus halophilus]|uniref:Cytochrome C n=1 Tax=Rhodosalinus halophilus TaxID=2259333 RepID=A0A365U661_9RHOB|nr:c-type cytochrome [Rhodosalinus halophilus]RBI82782.1 cytochrome C [Rhodosalinus halophilus]
MANAAARHIAGLVWAALLAGAALADEEAVPIGDADRGAELYTQCVGCHQVGRDAENRIGPHLNDLFGRRAGAIDGFRYSEGLARMGADGLTWTLETLDAYIENPRALVSRTRMAYPGMESAEDRADLLAYLRQFSASPANIPEAEPTAIRREVDLPPEVLEIAGDPAYGEYLSAECTTCHRRDGASEGIPSITNWPEEDFVVAMHAYKQQIRPHPVMQMMAGRLSDEEIAALAAYFARID